jgi:hypothetical protein
LDEEDDNYQELNNWFENKINSINENSNFINKRYDYFIKINSI